MKEYYSIQKNNSIVNELERYRQVLISQRERIRPNYVSLPIPGPDKKPQDLKNLYSQVIFDDIEHILQAVVDRYGYGDLERFKMKKNIGEQVLQLESYLVLFDKEKTTIEINLMKLSDLENNADPVIVKDLENFIFNTRALFIETTKVYDELQNLVKLKVKELYEKAEFDLDSYMIPRNQSTLQLDPPWAKALIFADICQPTYLQGKYFVCIDPRCLSYVFAMLNKHKFFTPARTLKAFVDFFVKKDGNPVSYSYVRSDYVLIPPENKQKLDEYIFGYKA
jgi:hypothetical protein